MDKQDEEFAKGIENKVKSTIKKFGLLNRKEKTIVAVSGGKDSTAVLYMLHKWSYNTHAVAIDVNLGEYSKRNIENLKKFCKESKIPLYVISIREEFGNSHCSIRQILASRGIKLNSCAVCGVLRRYLLNKAAKKLKAKKLVTGHNLDDECQAIMMNFFRNTLHWSARQGPKSGISKSKAFVQRVKPLFFISENDIEKYSKIMNFPVKYGKCPCSSDVFRGFVEGLLDDYEKENSKIKENIMAYFLKIQPKLRQKYQGLEYSYCEKCGEPSKGKVCRACQIIGELQKV